MQKTRNILMALLLLIGGAGIAQAHDFSAVSQGQTFYFNILNASKKTVEVTFRGTAKERSAADYRGEISIPSTITYKQTKYQVKGIGKKAFSGATELTGVVMPSGLEGIGDFAFEGCTALTKVIFPGNPVEMGQGIFFKCNAITDVTFGSDWTEVNLMMFRWSNTLAEVNIPAKVSTIKNMKSLKGLASITVDKNNSNFSSVDGVLYNARTNAMLGCPRAKEGKLRVPEGVARIKQGALIDCLALNQIDLPASLTDMSLRELGRLTGLQLLIMRGTTPPTTAMQDGNPCTVLLLGNQKCTIVVPKESLKQYKTALAVKPGTYTEVGDKTPYNVEATQLPIVKKLVGAKDFTKYE